jgi:hypothetical protein
MRALLIEFQLFHDEGGHALLDLAIKLAGARIERVVEIEDPSLDRGEGIERVRFHNAVSENGSAA